MTKTIKVKTSFTPEYLETPENYTIELTPDLIANVKLAWDWISKFEGLYETITLPCVAEPSEEIDEWRPDNCKLIIYWTGNVYYYEQSKYDAHAQVESEEIPIEKFIGKIKR